MGHTHMLSKVSLFLSVGCAWAKTALLVIDVQDCFLEAACTSTGEEGSLSVPGCNVITNVNKIREEKSCLFDEVIFSQDFHPTGHISFGSTHGLQPFHHLFGKGGLPLLCTNPTSGMTQDGDCCPTIAVDPSLVDCETQLCPPDTFNYSAPGSITDGNAACTTCRDDPSSCFATEQAMWTDHCLQNGDSTFPTTLDMRDEDVIVQKGVHKFVDAYSAFMDNTQSLKTMLDDELKAKGITDLIVTGIATDVCVQWTVTDALGDKTADYTVRVVQDATAPVLGDMANFNASIAIMAEAGATIVNTEDILAMECPMVPTVAPVKPVCPPGCSSSMRRRLLFSSMSCPPGC